MFKILYISLSIKFCIEQSIFNLEKKKLRNVVGSIRYKGMKEPNCNNKSNHRKYKFERYNQLLLIVVIFYFRFKVVK